MYKYKIKRNFGMKSKNIKRKLVQTNINWMQYCAVCVCECMNFMWFYYLLYYVHIPCVCINKNMNFVVGCCCCCCCYYTIFCVFSVHKPKHLTVLNFIVSVQWVSSLQRLLRLYNVVWFVYTFLGSFVRNLSMLTARYIRSSI